jgi:hypothetical protein
LVFRKPPQQRCHRVGRSERRADEDEKQQDVGESTGTVDCSGQQAEEHGHPCRSECEQDQKADEPQARAGSGSRAKPDDDRHYEHKNGGEQIRER